MNSGAVDSLYEVKDFKKEKAAPQYVTPEISTRTMCSADIGNATVSEPEPPRGGQKLWPRCTECKTPICEHIFAKISSPSPAHIEELYPMVFKITATLRAPAGCTIENVKAVIRLHMPALIIQTVEEEKNGDK